MKKKYKKPTREMIRTAVEYISDGSLFELDPSQFKGTRLEKRMKAVLEFNEIVSDLMEEYDIDYN